MSLLLFLLKMCGKNKSKFDFNVNEKRLICRVLLFLFWLCSIVEIADGTKTVQNSSFSFSQSCEIVNIAQSLMYTF